TSACAVPPRRRPCARSTRSRHGRAVPETRSSGSPASRSRGHAACPRTPERRPPGTPRSPWPHPTGYGWSGSLAGRRTRGHALDYLEDELVELETNGLLLHPRTLEGPTGARATFDGGEVINLASNNYLGLSNHPRMNRAAADAAERFGAGTGAVRTIAGQMRMHLDLEERFAAFKHADAALLFQSGFTANAGTVAAILGPDDVIVSDRLNHASIIDGARLSKAEIKVFEHRDAADAERLLTETAKPGRRQLLITD